MTRININTFCSSIIIDNDSNNTIIIIIFITACIQYNNNTITLYIVQCNPIFHFLIASIFNDTLLADICCYGLCISHLWFYSNLEQSNWWLRLIRYERVAAIPAYKTTHNTEDRIVTLRNLTRRPNSYQPFYLVFTKHKVGLVGINADNIWCIVILFSNSFLRPKLLLRVNIHRQQSQHLGFK